MAAALLAILLSASGLYALQNDARADHGLRPLRVSHAMERRAERHSRAMARRGYLFHSDLQLRGWSIVGENVGVGDTVRSVFRAFMRSKPHRKNILRRAFDHAGAGIVRRGGLVWVTVEFGGT